jgi:hypothetical protein
MAHESHGGQYAQRVLTEEELLRDVWGFKVMGTSRRSPIICAVAFMLETREDKPLTKLRTTITNQEGTTVLDGSAMVWTEPV